VYEDLFHGRLRKFIVKKEYNIFGTEREMLVLRQRKLYNDELHNLCSLRNVIRIDKKKGE
jgi:hypothetical protein